MSGPYGVDSRHNGPMRYTTCLRNFRNEKQPTLGRFDLLVAAVEFVSPRYRVYPAAAHDNLTGWARSVPCEHAMQCMKPQVRLYGAALSPTGLPRLGFSMTVQTTLGLLLRSRLP